MAQINTTDLGQILIKETTADTNDVFNVLISQGAKGGLAVAAQLINVLNISIPFHHVPRSLNSPSLSLDLSLCHSLSLPPSSQRLFRTIADSPWPPPPPYKVNLKVCKVVLLCVLSSCGHCVLNHRKIKDGVKTDNRILASNAWKSTHVFQLQNTWKKSNIPLFSVQVNDVKSMKRDFWITCMEFKLFFVLSLCVAPFRRIGWKEKLVMTLKKKKWTRTKPYIVNFWCRQRERQDSLNAEVFKTEKKKLDIVAFCEW